MYQCKCCHCGNFFESENKRCVSCGCDSVAERASVTSSGYLAPFDEYFEEVWSGTNKSEKRIGRTISVYAWNAAITEVLKITTSAVKNDTLASALANLDKLMVR